MTHTSLCLLDGSSLLFRSYYGVRPLHTSSGIPTQAIYGFCRTLAKITDTLTPSHVVVVWDTKGPTFRHEQFAQYKATRQAPPSDLIVQKEAIIQFLSTIGVQQISRQGYEADDLLYSLTKEHHVDRCIIVTGDKDLQQLISPSVEIFDPFKQKQITLSSFLEERHFEPEHLLLYHALLGDSSDNIPGVKGVGSKTAQQLTEQFGTLESLYAHLDRVTPPHIASLLAQGKDNAFLSKELFTLRYTPTELSLTQCAYNPHNWTESASFFQQYEIKPFYPKSVTPPQQQSLFTPQVESTSTTAQKKNWTAHLITTVEQLDDLITKIRTSSLIAIDTETTSLAPFQTGIIGISCALNEHEGYYIPFGHITSEAQLSKEVVLGAFKEICESTAIKKVLQNAKFDQAGFAHHGIQLQGIAGDTLLMASLLRKGSESISLKALSVHYLSEEMTDYATVSSGKKNFADVPLSDACSYAAHDAVQTYKLFGVLTKKLAQHKDLEALYTTIELPLSNVLWDMEQTGIALNTDHLARLAEHVRKELTTIAEKIETCLHAGQQRIGGTINFNSPAQLESLLFDDLQLPSIKKSSKTGKRSTDNEVLQELSKIHPVPGLIIRYRELTKLLNTYLEPLPHQINPLTGKVHTTYSQTITATGRLASSEPNLQNIPLGGDYGSQVRTAFIAPEGSILLSADYSQIELRILAEFSKDTALLAAFADNKDIHTQTSALIFGVPESEVTSEQRQVGKKINFSIMYGLTPFRLSKDLNIPPKMAKEYIENYFTTYAGVATWMEALIAQAKEDGYVSTLLGRRRYVPGLHERNKIAQEAERRIAINTPIQGTSADLIKLAMLSIHKRLAAEGLKSRMVLQIHDELLFSVPESELDTVTTLISECMINVVSNWSVPLSISTRSGKNWGEASK